MFTNGFYSKIKSKLVLVVPLVLVLKVLTILVEVRPSRSRLKFGVLVDVNQKANQVFTKTNEAVCFTLSRFFD